MVPGLLQFFFLDDHNYLHEKKFRFFLPATQFISSCNRPLHSSLHSSLNAVEYQKRKRTLTWCKCEDRFLLVYGKKAPLFEKQPDAGCTVIKTAISGIVHSSGMIDLILSGKLCWKITFCIPQISLRFSWVWDSPCVTQLHITVMFCLMIASSSFF